MKIGRVIRAAPSELQWKRSGAEWILYQGKRRVGRVVPDSKYAGMYRIALPSGRLSDMANLSWAKSLALDAAERELVYEAPDTFKMPGKRGGILDTNRAGFRFDGRPVSECPRPNANPEASYVAIAGCPRKPRGTLKIQPRSNQ